jgi:hypothetical protein
LVEVVGSAFKEDPEQTAETGLNVGTTFGLTVIVNVSVVAQRPDVGVKVYKVVVVLLIVGLQVPVIPFVEVVGSVGAVSPEQMGATVLKVGVIGFETVTLNSCVEAQGNRVEFGVKV